ncbi:hypothetical protein CLV98_11170 [Dyadobacter jejuensis]|uniref:Spy/CpxP family protein refolding chaperone n=1 Tax=Dyadobacter jejuensis TaxID=1082580 RepID=A0A316AFL4_9BACT|nr:hypothetical protein [Dyadobacter jejuensis]PWJ56576.1 hypothetical protein CLV98_11170 [Dyadobacter jejuensis]
MKKAILTIAALTILSLGNSFAQRAAKVIVVQQPKVVSQPVVNYNVATLDRIVKLSRQQESQILKIEREYDLLARNRRAKNQGQLELQKQKDIIAVLTPKQYDRLKVYEKGLRNSRVAYRY